MLARRQPTVLMGGYALDTCTRDPPSLATSDNTGGKEVSMGKAMARADGLISLEAPGTPIGPSLAPRMPSLLPAPQVKSDYEGLSMEVIRDRTNLTELSLVSVVAALSLALPALCGALLFHVRRRRRKARQMPSLDGGVCYSSHPEQRFEEVETADLDTPPSDRGQTAVET